MSFETPEFITLPRGMTWYVVAGGLVALLIAYAAYTGSLSMAIVFALIAGLFILVQNKKPRTLSFSVTNMGVFYDEEFYPYNQIDAFWIVYHPPYIRSLYLNIRNGKRLNRLKVELDAQDPQELRALLLKEVPEAEGANEPMSDLIIRILRLQ